MNNEKRIEKYDKTGYICYGSRIKIDRYTDDNIPDIGPLIASGRGEVIAQQSESIDLEDKAFAAIGAAIDQWQKQAAITRSCNQALAYLNTMEVSHTRNIWVKQAHNQGEKISNRVFSMSCHIWETTRYDYKQHKDIAVCYATWDLFLNTPRQGYGRRIAGQQDKRFTDRAAAEKYLEGRKKAYSAYFIEISPPIPLQYRESFMVHGHLLPGYTVEGMESKRNEQEKPSVLVKLCEAKTNHHTASEPSTTKKKEGMEL